MQATVLNITDRKRERLSQISSLANFTCTPGESVDPGQILQNPNLSLYCLDPTTRQAIFTELPPGIDLAQAPFYYQAQFDHAQRLIAVPYDVLHQLAEQISLDPSRLVLIHNIGRCGSTLLNTVFNELDSMMSLSEPDVFSNFVLLRNHEKSERIRLLHSCLKIVFRPIIAGQVSSYGLKFRNQCVDIMDLYFEAFPQANHLFLYRNGLDWVASLYRLMARRAPRPPLSRDEALTQQAAYMNRERSSLERFFDPTIASYPEATYLAVSWLVMIDRALELFSQGFRPLTLRYEDLNRQPEPILTAIFDTCGLPMTGVRQALQAFERDSQRDTVLARADAQSGNTIRLPEEIVRQIHSILSHHPVIRQPDFILPGTLMLD